MFMQENLNKKRCLECKRRKKKCQVQFNNEKCDYCSKKGIDCYFPKAELVRATSINGKITRHHHPKLITESKNNRISMDVDQAETKNVCNDNLSNIGIPVIYMPVHSLNRSTGTLMIHEDTKSVKVYNDDTIMGEFFSLFDFILSSTRISSLNSNDCDIKKDILNISRPDRSFRKIDAINILKSNKIFLPPNKNNKSSKIHLKKSPTQDMTLKMDKINIEIRLERLQNVFFINEPAVMTDVDGKKFFNLPPFINKHLADTLFNYFCDISRGDQTVKTSKVNFLKVCLPLIFGSITVLKCVLLFSYYHLSNTNADNQMLLELSDEMYLLHVEVITELSERLVYYTSVCCDHSILCVFLLLTIEMNNGARGKLWKKLQKLAQNMISLRGGVEKLCSTITGQCIVKLIVAYLCTEINLENNSLSIGLNDFLYIINHNNKVGFFDNFVSRPLLGLNELKDIVQIYCRISLLYSLIHVSLDANTDQENNISKLLINYDLVSSSNMHHVLVEADTLERSINEFKFDIPDKISICHEIQIFFTIHASNLYLYQIVHKQAPISPKTVMLVKLLLNEVTSLFSVFMRIPEKEINQTTILILPLFCLGIDIIGPEIRLWYTKKLNELYLKFKREMIKTAIDLLQNVWERNFNGNIFVDWKSMSDEYSFYVSLCC